ncbi:MAG: hypothetical protein ACI84O_001168 [Myxococcota bacterium]|jgi:hypothetical protein
MRTLLALVAFVLVLAYAVWFKTTPEELPPTKAPQNSSLGIVTLGITSNEAGASTTTPPDAVEAVSESTDDATKDIDNDTGKKVVHQPLLPPTPEPIPDTDPIPAVDTPLNYIVQDGDTMYRIIKRCYGTYSESILQDVADANSLRDPSAIGVGDQLVLPLIDGVSAPRMR